VDVWIFLVAALLLSLERICYIWIWRHPHRFRAIWADADPVDALRYLFYGFKFLQLAVFAGWCYFYGGAIWPARIEPPAMALGMTLLIAGQGLKFSVFYRLGNVGVFYGKRFGHHVPWIRSFPFSVFEHPQYLGAVLSIWGLFLILRFPHADWYALPMLETIYYAIGARFER
jgi:methylene-fatty-acyl-phospholipid synthase